MFIKIALVVFLLFLTITIIRIVLSLKCIKRKPDVLEFNPKDIQDRLDVIQQLEKLKKIRGGVL